MKILYGAEDAIEQAIDGGLREGKEWKFLRANNYWVVWLDGNGNETTISMLNYLVDPLFGEALGRTRGWFEGWAFGFSINWFTTKMLLGDEKKFWNKLP